MPCEDCSELIFFSSQKPEAFSSDKVFPEMKLITETTELWVSITNTLSIFTFFSAGSDLSATYKALKALALKSKAEIMPSPTKRIIHLLSLSVTMMWF